MRSECFAIFLVLVPALILFAEGDVSERIFNGQDAVRGQFPFFARCVQVKNSNGTTFCGGSILSDRWILTAAHCAKNTRAVTIYLGLTDLKNLTGVITTYVDTSGIYMHPLYNSSNQNYDIALYKLNTSIPFSNYPYIQTISLPNHSMSDASYFDNYNATIAGFGSIDNAGSSPRILQWANAHIFNHEQCKKANSYPITENMVCTDKKVFNTGICPGDSGGPLVVVTPDNIPRVVGASSWITGGCNSTFTTQYAYSGSPGILSWIMSTTGIIPK